MAGSGKTTLMQQITEQLVERNLEGYTMNLDPAVLKLPYYPNIDIRDTVSLDIAAYLMRTFLSHMSLFPLLKASQS